MFRFSPEVEHRLRESRNTIIVTGAGGWLGRATLELCAAALGDRFPSRVKAFASSSRDVELVSGRTVSLRPLEALDDVTPSTSFVFHYAYLGKEKVAQYGNERYVEINREINDRVLSFCRSMDGGGVFFASSGAAYFAGNSEVDRDREPYGAEKVRDERRFLALADSGLSVLVNRIFNLAGPFMNKVDIYALSCIILDILNQRPIRLRASNRVYRSYAHVRDVIELATRLLLDDACPSAPIDAAGEEVVEVGELALRCAAVLTPAPVQVIRPAVRYDADDRYVGDGTAFRRLARETNLVLSSLDQQIRDTSAYLAASA